MNNQLTPLGLDTPAPTYTFKPVSDATMITDNASSSTVSQEQSVQAPIMSPYDFEKLCRAQLAQNTKDSFLPILIVLAISMQGYEWTDVHVIAKELGLREGLILSKPKVAAIKKLGFVKTRKVPGSKGLKHQLRVMEHVDLATFDTPDGQLMKRIFHDLSMYANKGGRVMTSTLIGLILIAIHVRRLQLTKDINQYIGGDVTLWQGRTRIMERMAKIGLLTIKDLGRGAKPKLCVSSVAY
jgi:hypothetical protein